MFLLFSYTDIAASFLENYPSLIIQPSLVISLESFKLLVRSISLFMVLWYLPTLLLHESGLVLFIVRADHIIVPMELSKSDPRVEENANIVHP